MQSRRSVLTAFAALAAATPVLAQTAMVRSELATMIATTGRVSLLASRIGLAKTESVGDGGTYHKFAQAEIDEQEMLGREFARLGVQPMAPMAADAATLTKLEATAGGRSFDLAYMEAMKEGHAKIEAEMVRAQAGSDAELAALATKALPLVREHLAIATGAVSKLMMG